MDRAPHSDHPKPSYSMLAREFGTRPAPTTDPAERDPRHQLGQALERLFTALNNLHEGDPLPLRHVWSHSEDVTLATPTKGLLTGWDHVRTELDRDARTNSGWTVIADDITINLCADAAWALCTERCSRPGAPETRHQSTNIFRRESGAWRLVHRQISPVHAADVAAQNLHA